MLSLEYFDMSIVCFGLFVGYCYNLDYRLVDDNGVLVITVICWG